MLSQRDCEEAVSFATRIAGELSSAYGVLFEFSNVHPVGAGGIVRFDVHNARHVAQFNAGLERKGAFVWSTSGDYGMPKYIVKVGVGDFSSHSGRLSSPYSGAVCSMCASIAYETDNLDLG